MRDFPQELVDLVIDKLAEPTPKRFPRWEDMSKYSTVSRQWVGRTQKYHFRFLLFSNQDKLERWCAESEADPSGLSRHVRNLTLNHINTLQDFDDHIRAFAHLRSLTLRSCRILRSLSDVESLVRVGSTLVQLAILGTIKTTPYIMTSFLAGLPCLRYLRLFSLSVDDDLADATMLPPSIPFFEGGAGTLDLSLMAPRGVSFDWIPPTARFRNLEITARCARDRHKFVNQWLVSSGRCLQSLIIREDPLNIYLDHLDLSGCTSLKYLEFPISVDEPGRSSDPILSSLSSSQLSKIALGVREPSTPNKGPRGWETTAGHLCRLARLYEGAHGRKMKVEFYLTHLSVRSAAPLKIFECPMPGLKEVAVVKSLWRGSRSSRIWGRRWIGSTTGFLPL